MQLRSTLVPRQWFQIWLSVWSFPGLWACSLVEAQDQSGASFDRGPDTQAETSAFLSDAEAVAAWTMPPGFSIQLFSSSPNIAQPIAATFDRFGRMWVAENYTYAELPQRFDRNLRDRIVVLPDSNHDGIAEAPTVFYDQAQLLASVEVGMGGVWMLGAPKLVFIPDRDLDGTPDGEPQVILDGFEDHEVGHNLVNGLRWGPDGWLYGRHGIQATSHVGKPGTPRENRIPLNCCIWRYHPTHEKFEVVTQGTTNPWGHDWDEHGELFFINTVIGHLWHAIPGLHTERMYGEDLQPHLFHLTAQVADHFHWDRQSEAWMQQRDGMTVGTDAAGGGHAHSGLAFYQGYRWPAEYHGDVYTLNFHGRRLNRDKLKPFGATFTAEHCPDPLKTSDPWFRGIDLFCGPDDAMYMLDWSDLGECHENDGIHRSSGRIYRADYQAPGDGAGNKSPRPTWNVAEVVNILNGTDLLRIARLLHDQRPWVWRQARLRLQEHAHGFGRLDAGLAADLAKVNVQLWQEFQESESSDLRFRLLTGMWATGLLPATELTSLLVHDDPHVRVWAIRLLTDSSVAGSQQRLAGLSLGSLTTDVAQALLQLAKTEQHGLVLTYLASSMRLMSANDRWAMACQLTKHGSLAEDRVYPYLVWYGLEPSVASHAGKITELLSVSKIAIVDQFLARRLAIEYTYQRDALRGIVAVLRNEPITVEQKVSVLSGLAEGWNGWNDLPKPEGWSELAAELARDPMLAPRFEQLATVFENRQSLADRLALLADERQTLDLRGSLIRSVVRDLESVGETWSDEHEQAVTLLGNLLSHRFLAVGAANGLARWSGSRATGVLIQKFQSAPPAGQVAIISALCERAERAKSLLLAVQKDSIPRAAISANQLRQVQLIGDEATGKLIAEIWPELSSLLGQSQMQQIQKFRDLLTPESIADSDLTRGKELFQQQCGKCHRLFGAGETLGPELTGAQRDNLNYWLQNIVAPSAEVNTEYRLSLVQMADGRTLSGVVTQRTPAAFVLVSQDQTQLIKLEDVEEVRALNQSLMPDGLLDAISDADKRHLFAYLMSQTGQ
ncbi:MAG: c-type cytochrome [Pirellulaceae bacterium]|nr:c-type cytochrome [Pirellulaceae bacterium]